MKPAPPVNFDPFEVSNLVASYYDIQKVRVAHLLRCKQLERRGIKLGVWGAEDHYDLAIDELRRPENLLLARIKACTQHHPVRTRFLAKIRGIGPVLTGGVIAQIERRHQVLAETNDGRMIWVPHRELFANDGLYERAYAELDIKTTVVSLDPGLGDRRGIACFDTISKLWAYAGLKVVVEEGIGHAHKREKGVRYNVSTNFKVLAWKVGASFEKCGRSYREEYLKYKARKTAEHPKPDGNKWTKGHLRNMALRYAAKLFLSHLWLVWRELESLPVRDPYPLEHGHTTPKPWQDYCDKSAAEPDEAEVEVNEEPEHDDYA